MFNHCNSLGAENMHAYTPYRSDRNAFETSHHSFILFNSSITSWMNEIFPITSSCVVLFFFFFCFQTKLENTWPDGSLIRGHYFMFHVCVCDRDRNRFYSPLLSSLSILLSLFSALFVAIFQHNRPLNYPSDVPRSVSNIT